jgi:16S rRNA A1518/A1519 N6-dimethyltransferase RsmA/KsgA/DIM1 with predicted DNA glycosylase/AP lyase activity
MKSKASPYVLSRLLKISKKNQNNKKNSASPSKSPENKNKFLKLKFRKKPQTISKSLTYVTGFCSASNPPKDKFLSENPNTSIRLSEYPISSGILTLWKIFST